jgi:uridylate kinase
MANTPHPRRVLLKLSGEALMGQDHYGINPQVIARVANEVKNVVAENIQLGIVIGGGNIFRGAGLTKNGIDRVTGDYMGMLATVMNCLAMQDALGKAGVHARVMSAIRIDAICEDYTLRRAISHLERGRVVLFASGTGNPFFTTDSAASLRAIEIRAHLMIKATKVDGVYDQDPVKNPAATRFEQLSYQDVIERDLGVMDTTAVVLCRDNKMPMRVINMNQENAILRAARGETEGTLIIS